MDGPDVARASTRDLARVLAVLPQSTGVATRLAVRGLVAFGRWPHHRGRPGSKDEGAGEDALTRFDLLSIAHRWLDALSGGPAQRAHVAMAVARGTL